MLEEGSFRGRTADFVFMFMFGGVIMTVSLILLLINLSYVHFFHCLKKLDSVLKNIFRKRSILILKRETNKTI